MSSFPQNAADYQTYGLPADPVPAWPIVDRIDEWLVVNDISQTELGRKAGLGEKYASVWWSSIRKLVMEGEQHTVAPETVRKLIGATGMSLRELTEPFK